MKSEICTQIKNLPGEINPYYIHVFSKNMKKILQYSLQTSSFCNTKVFLQKLIR